MSYLDSPERNNPDTIMKVREERIAMGQREVDPAVAAEERELRAEKQARVNAELAIAARRLARDPEILAQDAVQAAERERDYEAQRREEAERVPDQNEPDYY